MVIQCVCAEGGSTHEYMALFRKAIEGNEPELVRRIETESGLWTHLRAKKVLTDRLIAECKAKVGLFHLIIFGLLKMSVIMSVYSAFMDICQPTDQAIQVKPITRL